MGSLSNLYISQSYTSLIHLGSDTTATSTLVELQDGLGNGLGVSVNTNGDLSLEGSLTASLQEGYVWVGDDNGKTKLVATSSFAENTDLGPLNAFTASQIPFNASATASIVQLQNFSSSLDATFVTEAELAAATASLVSQINTKLNTSSFNTYTGSNNQRVSSLEANSASLNTSASLGLVTASFNNGTRNLTFTKGDNTTFNVNIPDVSGSAGDFVTTSSFNAYTQSTDSSISQLNASSASQQISINALNTNTASVNTSISALNTFTSSQETINSGLSVVISQKLFSSSFNAYTASNNQRVSSLEINSESVNTSITNVNSATASLFTSVNNINTFTQSAQISINSLNSFTASIDTNFVSEVEFAAYTSSNDGKVNSLIAATASYANSASVAAVDSAQQAEINSLTSATASYANSASVASVDAAQQAQINSLISATSSYADSASFAASQLAQDGRLNNLESTSASVNTSISNLNTFTQSQEGVNSLLAGEIDSLQAKTGSYATTGSNVFTADQTIIGTLNVDTINATTIHTIIESSSVIFSSGSNLLGDELTDTQTLSGSVKVQGSLTVNGTPVLTSSVDISGLVTTASFNAYTQSNDSKVDSLINATASYANSASVAAVDLAQQSQINSLINATASYADSASVAASQLVQDGRLNNLESTSASVNISISNLNASSASQQVSINALNSFTASIDANFVSEVEFGTYTSSTNSRLNNIESATSSYANSASVAAVDLAQQSQIDNLIAWTSSVSPTNISALNAFTASQLTINTGYNTFTQSIQSEVDSLQAATASYALSASVAAVDSAQQAEINSLIAETGSVNTSLTSLNSFTASQSTINSGVNTFTASANQRLTAIESVSGSWITESETSSFARTNVSNTFTEAQTINADLNVSGTINAYKLNVIIESSSVIYSSGSNQFGDAANDTQTLYGSTNVVNELTASGLHYPTADNGEKSFLQTDGNGNLSLQYVKTVYETVRNTNPFPIVKGAPLFASGSTGDNANVFYADAADSAIMPAVYIAGETLAPGATGLAIVGGLIEGVDTTGLPAGTIVYVAEGGGWSANRPSGSNSIVQVLGVVQKEGVGGQGVVINQLEAVLPNLQTGYTWVGDGTNQPVLASTSSFGTPTDLGPLNAFTQSAQAQLTSLENATSSYANSASVAAVDSAQQSQINSLIAATASYATSAITASSLITASVSGTTMTFTKGDASTFNLTLPTGSGGTIDTGSFATTGSNTFRGDQIISGSGTYALDVNGSLNLTPKSPSTSAGIELRASNSTTRHAYINFHSGDIWQLSSGKDGLRKFQLQLSSQPIWEVGQTGSFDFKRDVNISGSLTASLAQGYTWVGNGSNVSTLVSTSSFGGGGGDLTSLNAFTASQELLNTTFATTGSNVFNGTQTISGSILVSGSVELYGSGSDGFGFKGKSLFLTNSVQTGITIESPLHFYKITKGDMYLTANVGDPTSTGSMNITVANGRNLNISASNVSTIGNADITGNLTVSTDITADRLVLTGGTGVDLIVTGSGKISQTLQVGPSTGDGVLLTQYGISAFNSTTGDELGITNNGLDYGITGWDGPSIYGNDPDDTFPAFIGFQNKADWTDGTITVLTPLVAKQGLEITGSTEVGTFTASLAQGYVWVGDSSGKTTTVATSSFGGSGIPAGTISSSAQITSLGFVSSSVTASSIVTASVNLNTITFTKGDLSTFALTVDTGSGGGGGASFPYSGSVEITGSVKVKPFTLSVASQTASIDMNESNYFILNLPTSSTTHVAFTNIIPGESINLLVSQSATAATGSISFAPNIYFPGGNDFVATATGSAKDIVSFITFNSNEIYATNVKNLK